MNLIIPLRLFAYLGVYFEPENIIPVAMTKNNAI